MFVRVGFANEAICIQFLIDLLDWLYLPRSMTLKWRALRNMEAPVGGQIKIFAERTHVGCVTLITFLLFNMHNTHSSQHTP
jgi:hypothetical protein